MEYHQHRIKHDLVTSAIYPNVSFQVRSLNLRSYFTKTSLFTNRRNIPISIPISSYFTLRHWLRNSFCVPVLHQQHSLYFYPSFAISNIHYCAWELWPARVHRQSSPFPTHSGYVQRVTTLLLLVQYHLHNYHFWLIDFFSSPLSSSTH